MLVNGAVPLRGMEELACALEDVILTVPKHAMPIAFDELCKFGFRLFVTKIETLRQSFDIAFRNQDPIIRAAIRGTF